jgi:Ca2+-transporting ATPase
VGLRVVFTGGETIYGQIVRSAGSGIRERTPLQQAIGSLVAVLVVVAIIICAGLAATRFYQGHGVIDAILSAVTLAVAALPEEFPVVFSFFLGVGVYRLAARQALVRRAVVVENIGRVTCICCDKTGTLTEGRLHLAHVNPVHGIDDERLLQAAATASRSGGGDPLDLAILAFASKIEGTLLATFPFTEDRRRETSVVRTSSGTVFCAAKGAPEAIVAMSRLSEAERGQWLAMTRQFASTGHKVIACCDRTLPGDAWGGGEPDRDYNFLGLMAFEDPVRDGVAMAVTNARLAGIRVIMVTGDHPATARAIATEIGIGSGVPRVIDGDDLNRRLGRGGIDGLQAFDVIARAMPAHKLDLVRALRNSGEIVAVTGDGVNDVPALQGADIGIAMGERGTQTAREVASIVLLDDNFRTIVGAIAEGRQLFSNLKLSFAYLLMIHMPLVVTAALIPFAGFPLLYLPVHIVWLELIIHPTALLVFQQLPPLGLPGRVDRRDGTRFFDFREWTVIAAVGTVITIVLVLGYVRSLGAGHVEHARTMALAVLIVASSTVTVGLSHLRTAAAMAVVAMAVASAIALIQVPAFAELLHLTPLHRDDWIIAAAGGVIAGSLSALLPYVDRLRIVDSEAVGASPR